jgi:hypothetical protein
MAVKQQFSVCLPNQPGQLAKVCGVLRQAKVNIVAMSVADTSDTCMVRFICDSGAKARAAMKKKKMDVLARDVVAVELSNSPGSLETAAKKLAKAKINIDYVYATVQPKADSAMVVFAVDNPKKANQAIG